MGDEELELNIFEQINEALEERQSSDRRKKDLGAEQATGENRRKGDRRTPDSDQD